MHYLHLLWHLLWILPAMGLARGVGSHAGGAYDASAQQDIIDGDAFQGPITVLTGIAGATADVINAHKSGNYMINSSALDPMTLALPTPGIDDGLTICIYSAVAFVHTLTLPSAQMFDGTAVAKTIATWTTGFIGQGLTLRAWNGTWHVIAKAGTITLS